MFSTWEEHFLHFINTFEEHIDWFELSSNPNLTMEMILIHIDKSWDWFNISQNPNLTMEMIVNNPECPW